MQVSYKKLFKTLIDNDMKKTKFAKKIGVGPNTLAKLSKNEYVSMDVLVRICIELDCSFDDVVEIVRDDVKVTK